ncbi:MAG TPA: hypothetical protein PLR24_12115 [Saprospiraceae bacterium]|nr:hypothetical protein [Saprospiraceae bacterium]
MRKPLSFVIVIILLGALAGGCNKERVLCADDGEFCRSITNHREEKSLSIINGYLNKQNKNLDDGVKLCLLKDWLECKSCIEGAEILCNSCIYTLPAQSELSLRLNTSGPDSVVVLDIIMSNPLQAVRFH